MNAPPPIEVLPLFSVLDHLLLALLRSLAPADWQRPTLAGPWTVHDVAAHLLAGNLQTLSVLRDGYVGERPDDASYAGTVAFLDRLNADWVRAARRLSPTVLIDWLARSGAEYTVFLATLDPWAPAAFAVAWAGETASLNWFHLARDYTEKWHHQQQIRAAVGQTAALLTPELFGPFMATLLRGLPHAYRHVAAPVGTRVEVAIGPTLGGAWQLVRGATGWALQPPGPGPLAARLTLDADTAWRVFTKGLGPAEARARARVEGDETLAAAALGLVAVMG